MDLDLTGKLALVTGSTRGIGLATAAGLAQMGTEVIVNGRDQAAITDAIARIRQSSPSAKLHGAAFDLGNAGRRLLRPRGKVSRGRYPRQQSRILRTENLLRDRRCRLDENVRGQRDERRAPDAALSQGDAGRQEWGRVVFVSSESGVYVPKEMVHYGFSKAALLYIARGAAEQTKSTGITVNSVLPGPTWVETTSGRLAARAKAMGTTVDDVVARTFSERRPGSLLQRFAKPEEIANLICYLCSKASSATDGAALRADGGIVTNPF